MAIYTPDTAAQVEARIKVDVQREAPDSNPYLSAHWLRSLIAGLARRVFDLYRDLRRTEQRLMPDTADEDTAPRWGNIYVGPPNAAAGAQGYVVAQGTAGASVPSGTQLASGGVTYQTTATAAIAVNSAAVASLVLSGTTATATTAAPHGLSSFVPVTITGAVEPEYNVTGAQVVVTGADTFTYTVGGAPTSPATGAVTAGYTSAVLPVSALSEGAATNLTLDSPLTLSAPIAGVANSLYVTYDAVAGGADAEAPAAYKARYLDKIRNPVAHFNAADIIAKAREVAGVTRVFVHRAGSHIGSSDVVSITRDGNIATVVTAVPHMLHDGQFTTITGAFEIEYNVANARVLVTDATTFHYIVAGSPATPATGTIAATQSVPLGQCITYFMRDNDADPIPSPAAVAAVKAKTDEILPANTATGDNIVAAPVPVVVPFVFSELVPNNPSMRAAVEANIAQFFEEGTTVGGTVDQDAYRAAIKNTIDTETGAEVQTFDLITPAGDILIATDSIAITGAVSFL